MDLGLAGTRAVITGGTRGIGRVVAEMDRFGVERAMTVYDDDRPEAREAAHGALGVGFALGRAAVAAHHGLAYVLHLLAAAGKLQRARRRL